MTSIACTDLMLYRCLKPSGDPLLTPGIWSSACKLWLRRHVLRLPFFGCSCSVMAVPSFWCWKNAPATCHTMCAV
jgi:hypothetical protein